MIPGQRCSAHRTDGEQCGAWAVRGTTVCYHHGGAAKQVRAKARREVLREEARRAVELFGGPRDIEPSQALLELVQWTAGEVQFWRGRVHSLSLENEGELTFGTTKVEFGQDKGQTTDMETKESRPHVYYTMLYAAQDRLAQYATAALRAGVEERRVRLAEQQGDLVALAIRRILAALSLSPEQEELVPVIVPRELRAISDVA